MTAEGFAAARAQLRLSIHQTKTFLRVKNPRLIRDWASGRKLIPHPIAAQLLWRLDRVTPRLFSMDIPEAGCGRTYFLIIAWNRAAATPWRRR
jgi:hypothetical protein